ncbi:MAG: hypothetical protein RR316_06255, partial [Clostridia bacterium]
MKTKRIMIFLLLLVAALLVFSSCSTDGTKLYYNVVFYDCSGKVFDTKVVLRHEKAECELPEAQYVTVVNSEGIAYTALYTPIGWKTDLSDITCDMIVEPAYRVSDVEFNSFVVTFLDANDNEIERQIVKRGENAVAPNIQIETGDVVLWDKDFTNIQSNLVVKASITKEYVTWIFDAGEGAFPDGEKEIVFEHIKYDEDRPIISIEGMPKFAHHNFVEWVLSVEQNGTIVRYTAKFEIHKFIVRFVDENDKEIKVIENVPYGASLLATQIPTMEDKPFYNFAGWENFVEVITENVTFKAKYIGVAVKYIYHDIDGKVFLEKFFAYGDVPSDPIAPEIIGKTFSEWKYDTFYSKDDNGEYYLNAYAQYLDGKWFKIAFVINGVLAKGQLVEEGKKAVEPTAESLIGYIPEGKVI